MKNTGANTERYQALNLQNENVLEIRLFRGTLNPSSFFKAFECVFAIYDFCLQMSFADLQINKRKKLNKESKQIAKHNDGLQVANISNKLIEKRFFHTFIYKNRKQYKSLNRFLSEQFGTIYNCGKDDSKVKELNQILNQQEGGYYSCV
jgi:predicted N-acyltransferase